MKIRRKLIDFDRAQTMTPAALRKAQDRNREDSSKVTTALIDAGRGHEKYSETLEKDDILSVAAQQLCWENCNLRSALKMKGFDW